MARRSKNNESAKGLANHLWQYDERRRSGWRLVPESRSRAAARAAAPHDARRRLTRYIGAGGMRHQERERETRRPAAGQILVRRIFAFFMIIWLLGRWLPL